MTPEFRNAIYKWNYNEEKDGNPDMCIPMQLQTLFGLLQCSRTKFVSTVALTKSFGWDNNEVFQQQDVQELNRKLFEALEEAFKDTEEAKVIDELFSGELIGRYML
jgi:ubiquitin carboxyl-terminal hydrolase 47